MQDRKKSATCESKTAAPGSESAPLLDTVETSDRKTSSERASERKRRGRRVAKQMRSIGLEVRASKIEQCGAMVYRRSFSCGHNSVTRHGEVSKFFACKDKFCPPCNHNRSMKLARTYGPALQKYVAAQGLHAYHFVLTFRNMETLPDYKTIRRQAKRIFDSGSIPRKAFWDRYGYRGGQINFEVTVDRDGFFHPHFHVLLLTERPIELIETGRHAGEFQNRVNQELSDLWLAITGDSYIVKGKSFEFSDMFEMVKYLTKGVDMMPDKQFSELVKWSNGKRFVSFIGDLYNNAELRELIENEGADDDDGAALCCPQCGCNEYVDVPMRFDPVQGKYVDDEYWTGEVFETLLRGP